MASRSVVIAFQVLSCHAHEVSPTINHQKFPNLRRHHLYSIVSCLCCQDNETAIKCSFPTNSLQIHCLGQMVQLFGQQVTSHAILLIQPDQTKVRVSINGPIEVPRRDELVSETTIDIQFRPIAGFPGSSHLRRG